MGKTTKGIVSCLAVFVLLSLAAGCDNKVKESDRGKEAVAVSKETVAPVKRVALVMKTLTNPFFIEMERGVRKAEKELGLRLIVKTGAQETSIEQQIAIVEDLARDMETMVDVRVVRKESLK